MCGGCKARFARVDGNIVGNPLAEYCGLVLRVRGSELDGDVSGDVAIK